MVSEFYCNNNLTAGMIKRFCDKCLVPILLEKKKSTCAFREALTNALVFFFQNVTYKAREIHRVFRTIFPTFVSMW